MTVRGGDVERGMGARRETTDHSVGNAAMVQELIAAVLAVS
jgi:hypothetical protein